MLDRLALLLLVCTPALGTVQLASLSAASWQHPIAPSAAAFDRRMAMLTPAIEPSAQAANSSSAAPVQPALGRWMLLLGMAALAGALYMLSRRQAPRLTAATTGAAAAQAAVTVGAMDENSATQTPASQPNQPQTNQPIDRAAAAIEPDATVQETTRLPKFDLAAELLRDLHSADPVLRRKAIWELGQRGESQAIQPLVDLMIDSDSQQRSLILAAIAEIGSRTLKPMQRALMISLQDESPDVRKNAIRDLTRIYDSIAQTSQLLTHALNDSDAEVQETAQWAINQLNRIRNATGVEDATVLLQNSVSESVLGDRSPSP